MVSEKKIEAQVSLYHLIDTMVCALNGNDLKTTPDEQQSPDEKSNASILPDHLTFYFANCEIKIDTASIIAKSPVIAAHLQSINHQTVKGIPRFPDIWLSVTVFQCFHTWLQTGSLGASQNIFNDDAFNATSTPPIFHYASSTAIVRGQGDIALSRIYELYRLADALRVPALITDIMTAIDDFLGCTSPMPMHQLNWILGDLESGAPLRRYWIQMLAWALSGETLVKAAGMGLVPQEAVIEVALMAMDEFKVEGGERASGGWLMDGFE